MINLVRNAIRYSHLGSNVHIRYSQYANQHYIKVLNWGIGVEAGIKDKMFELYERGENAKIFSRSGSGIGLSVASKLAIKMGGSIYLEEDDNPTIFTLRLTLN